MCGSATFRPIVMSMVLLCLILLGQAQANDTIETADLVNFNTVVPDTLEAPTDPADYFRITLPANGELTLTVTHDPSDFQFIVYGAALDTSISNLIAGTETNAPSGRQMVLTLEAGTYHINVNSRGNRSLIGYSMRLDFIPAQAVTVDVERNDDSFNASTLSTHSQQVGHISYTRDDITLDNQDYYRFSLGQDTTLELSFSFEPPEGDFLFRILAADGETQIFGTETNFPSGDTREVSLAAGTYYLKVEGRGSRQGRVYSFSVGTPGVISPSSACDCTDSDMDGVPNAWDQCPTTPVNSLVNRHGCS